MTLIVKCIDDFAEPQLTLWKEYEVTEVKNGKYELKWMPFSWDEDKFEVIQWQELLNIADLKILEAEAEEEMNEARNERDETQADIDIQKEIIKVNKKEAEELWYIGDYESEDLEDNEVSDEADEDDCARIKELIWEIVNAEAEIEILEPRLEEAENELRHATQKWKGIDDELKALWVFLPSD